MVIIVIIRRLIIDERGVDVDVLILAVNDITFFILVNGVECNIINHFLNACIISYFLIVLLLILHSVSTLIVSIAISRNIAFVVDLLLTCFSLVFFFRHHFLHNLAGARSAHTHTRPPHLLFCLHCRCSPSE